MTYLLLFTLNSNNSTMDENKKTPEQEAAAEVEATVTAPEAQAEPIVPAYRKRLRERYADFDPQSEDDWNAKTEEAFAEDAETIKAFNDNNKIIEDALASDKDLAAVVGRIVAYGEPFRAALAAVIDPASLEAKEGDDDYEYYQKNRDERIAIGKEMQRVAAEKIKNEEEAYKNIDAFCEAKGYDEEEKKNLISYINDFYNSLQMRKIDDGILQRLDNARNYEADIEEARAEGELDGKNANIEARSLAETRKQAGDGVPAFGGASTPIVDKPKKKSFFDDLPKRQFN